MANFNFTKLIKRAISGLLVATMIVSGAATSVTAAGGSNYVLSADNYRGSRGFGWDTYTKGATLKDKNGNDVYQQITVKVGSTTIPKNSTSYAKNSDVITSGVTISGIPAGYYISAYKITCDKYSCRTDQAGKATDEVVSLEAGQGTYSVTITKADMGHSNPSADNYWILIELSAFEIEDEEIVTYPYKVLYNYGELAEALASSPATTDANTYVYGTNATVLSPDASAVTAAYAIGYEFESWEIEKVEGSKAVTNGVVGTKVSASSSIYMTGETTLKAVWEKIPEPEKYDITYTITSDENPDGYSKGSYGNVDQSVANVEVSVRETLTTADTDNNGTPGTWTFSGWTTDDADIVDGKYTMPAGKVEFVGTWTFTEDEKYTVEYEYEGEYPAGVTVPTDANSYYVNSDVAVASSYGAGTIPSSKGDIPGTWTFNGWTLNNVKANTTEKMAEGGLTFVGTWTFEATPTYSISYRVEGITPDARKTDAIPAGESGVYAEDSKTVAADLTTTDEYKNGVLGTWTFNGWTTDDADVVDGAYTMPAGNVEFIGTWSFEATPLYDLTVHYVDENGEYIAAAEVTNDIVEDTPYETEAREIKGYDYVGISEDSDAASGEMNEDKTVIYVYSKDLNFYKLTVEYVEYIDGEKVAIDVNRNGENDDSGYSSFGINDPYTTSPMEITGYTFSEWDEESDSVKGIMDSDKVVTYIYDKTYYTLTVNYVDENGNEIANPVEDSEMEYHEAYFTTRKIIAGYTFVKTIGDAVSGIIDGDKEIIYIYSKNPDLVYYTLTVYFRDNYGVEIAEAEIHDMILENTHYYAYGKDIEGYEFKLTYGDPVFGVMDSDKVVTYMYVQEAVEIEENTPEETEPEETEPEEVNIPDEEVPLVDIPDEEVPQTDIPDEEVPQTDIPDEEVPQTDIPDEEVPLADIPDEEVPQTDIPDEEVPLADIPDEEVPLTDIPDEEVPQTGDSGVWLALFGISATTLVTMWIHDMKKKKKEKIEA